MVDGIRPFADRAWTRRLPAGGIASLFAAVAVLAGCDTVVYHPGAPPPDGHLQLSEVEIVSHRDTAKFTGRVSWTASWSVDSVEFRQRRYRLGVVFGREVSGWTPGPRSTAIAEREGTRSDTLRCDSGDCSWMSPKVMVLAQIDSGHFLSVAESTIAEPAWLFP